MFLPKVMQSAAFTLLERLGVQNVALSIVLFALFSQLATAPLTVVSLYRKTVYSKKPKIAGVFNEGFIYAIASIVLSIIFFSSVAYMPTFVPQLAILTEAELSNAFALFGENLMSTGLEGGYLVLIPVLYTLVSSVPSVISSVKKKRKARAEMIASLSEEDKALYLEEEKKINGKKVSFKKILVYLLPVYGFAISVFFPRTLTLYLLFCSLWRRAVQYLIKLVFGKSLKSRMAAAKEKSTEAENKN